MKRRDFVGMCAASAAVALNPVYAAANLKPRFYSRVQLVDEARQPLRAAAIAMHRNYVFHYPYESTPCFLLNLGRAARQPVTLKTENGGTYDWPGGAGPAGSIVGYSAICAHRLTYPTRQISFISYRDQAGPAHRGRRQVIHCCSEHSEYDPAAGGQVVGGPAPQPLSAILLEYEQKADAFYAVGTLGGELFDAFFSKYEFKLALEYGGKRAQEPVRGTAVVAELRNYCKQQVQC
jgi:arsenite oxidase small subunit